MPGAWMWCLDHPKTHVGEWRLLIFGSTLLLVPLIGGEFLSALDEGGFVGAGHDAIPDRVRRSCEIRAAGAQYSDLDIRRLPSWARS